MVKTNEEKIFSIREQPNDLAQIKKNLHHPWTKSINEDQSGVVLLSTSFETENIVSVVSVRTVRTGSIVVCRRRSMTRIKMNISSGGEYFPRRERTFKKMFAFIRIVYGFVSLLLAVGRPYTNQDRRPKSSPSHEIGSRLIECKLNLQGLKAGVLHLILRDQGLRVVFGHYT